MIAPIRKDHIEPNTAPRPGRKRTGITRVIGVHYPDAPGWSAQRGRNYFGSLDIEVSTQYWVDKTECIEIIPSDEIAWSFGIREYRKWLPDLPYGTDVNESAVSIEMSQHTEGYHEQTTIDNTIWLCAWLCHKYDLEPHHVLKRHHDITGKICPKQFVENPDEWDTFVIKVSDMLEQNILFETERGEYL